MEDFARKFDLSLQLENDIKLRVYLFSEREQRFVYTTYLMVRDPADHYLVLLDNRVSFRVDYVNGVAEKLELRMHIKIPEKRGKEFKWGVDISPNSMMYAEFDYSRKGNGFQLDTFRANNRLIFKTGESGLIQAIEFPYQVPDKLEPKFSSISKFVIGLPAQHAPATELVFPIEQYIMEDAWIPKNEVAVSE